MSDNFDRWLEDELGSRLDSVDPGYVAPRYLESSAPKRGKLAGLLAGLPLPALLTTKAAAASMVVLAATGTGVAVKTATTGTPNPLVWGQQVKVQVEKCKDALPAGQHGIGKCVSEFATQHSSTSSDSTDSSSDSTGDNGKSTSHPTPQGKSDSHPTSQGKSDSHPTPPPHPTPPASSNAGGNSVGNGNGKP
jgi:hypothetical protein